MARARRILGTAVGKRFAERTSRCLEKIEILGSRRKPLNQLVPGARIELALCYQNRILNPARLPVPPPRLSLLVNAEVSFCPHDDGRKAHSIFGVRQSLPQKSHLKRPDVSRFATFSDA